jgi:hypothetical protein
MQLVIFHVNTPYKKYFKYFTIGKTKIPPKVELLFKGAPLKRFRV